MRQPSNQPVVALESTWAHRAGRGILQFAPRSGDESETVQEMPRRPQSATELTILGGVRGRLGRTLVLSRAQAMGATECLFNRPAVHSGAHKTTIFGSSVQRLPRRPRVRPAARRSGNLPGPVRAGWRRR